MITSDTGYNIHRVSALAQLATEVKGYSDGFATLYNQSDTITDTGDVTLSAAGSTPSLTATEAEIEEIEEVKGAIRGATSHDHDHTHRILQTKNEPGHIHAKDLIDL